ncbi:PH domain-containing protein [Sphingomonas cavernae]|uniref:YdbS-like PH domain-containing protein n=1 Tax=Sphingomonas cavernae TaxID=2320861 RepID=A0A418WPA9_9SPHN|nr:PH domain-containing protein [Sphingomonas cavernae]RJF93060.1 hypothetical protein D3876_01395 [Sphingomonas cavernae]
MNEATVADRRLHPLSIGLRYLKNLPSTLLGLPALVTFLNDQGIEYFFVMVMVFGVAVLLINWIVWSRFQYGVGAHEIVIESGVISRNRRSIPFERIQDVDIERGPLERLLGLAKVRIETGGAGGDEGLLDSLSLAEADRLRAALRAGRARDQGAPGQPDETATAPVLFAMAVPRVLLSGLFNFSLLYLAGVFALLQTFEQFLPFRLEDWGQWIGFAEDRLDGRFTPATIAAVLLLALLLGVVTGVARTLARDYGFRLAEEPAGLRRDRGLFTRTEIVIPKRRIQLALIRRGAMKRLFGLGELLFQTLSADREGGGKQSVAPLAYEAEMLPILDAANRMRLPDKAVLLQVSRSHVLKAIASHTLVPLLVIAAAAVMFPAAVLGLALVPLLILAAIVERRAHRFALVDDTLYVQRGWWDQKLWIVPIRQAHTLTLLRSPIQRLLGLSTLLVDTAGASSLSDPRIVDLSSETATRLADALAEKLRRPAA